MNNILNIHNLTGTLPEQLNIIDENFDKISLSGVYKGEKGDTPHTVTKYFFIRENDSVILTNLGIDIFKVIFKDISSKILWTDVLDNIEDIINAEYPVYVNDDGISKCILDMFKYSDSGEWNTEMGWNFWSKYDDNYSVNDEDTVVSPYVFIDYRTQFLTEQNSYILESISEFKDKSCVLTYDSLASEHIQLSTMFPTLYYMENSSEDDKNWFWLINGEYTGISAQGLPGKTSNGRIHLVYKSSDSYIYYYEGVWLSLDQYSIKSNITLESGSIGFLIEEIEGESGTTGDLNYTSIILKISSYTAKTDSWSELTSVNGAGALALGYSNDFWSYVLRMMDNNIAGASTGDTSDLGIKLPIINNDKDNSKLNTNYQIFTNTYFTSSVEGTGNDKNSVLCIKPNVSDDEKYIEGEDQIKYYNLQFEEFDNIELNTKKGGTCNINGVNVSTIYSPYSSVIDGSSDELMNILQNTSSAQYISLKSSMTEDDILEINDPLKSSEYCMFFDGKFNDIRIKVNNTQTSIFNNTPSNILNVIKDTNIFIESDTTIKLGYIKRMENCNITFTGSGKLEIYSDSMIDCTINITEPNKDLQYEKTGVINNCNNLINTKIIFNVADQNNLPIQLFNNEYILNNCYDSEGIITLDRIFDKKTTNNVSSNINNINIFLKKYDINIIKYRGGYKDSINEFISKIIQPIILISNENEIVNEYNDEDNINITHYIIVDNLSLIDSEQSPSVIFNNLFTTSNSDETLSLNEYITNIEFPYLYNFNGVYDYMFQYMYILSNIENIKLYNTTSCRSMFQYCRCVNNIKIESNDKSIDCKNMFNLCTQLSNISLPDNFIKFVYEDNLEESVITNIFKNSSILCIDNYNDTHIIDYKCFNEYIYKHPVDISSGNNLFFIITNSSTNLSYSNNSLITSYTFNGDDKKYVGSPMNNDASSMLYYTSEEGKSFSFFGILESTQNNINKNGLFKKDIFIDNANISVFKLGLNYNIFNLLERVDSDSLLFGYPLSTELIYNISDSDNIVIKSFNIPNIFEGFNDEVFEIVLYPYNTLPNDYIINCNQIFKNCNYLNKNSIPGWILNGINTLDYSKFEDNISNYDKELFIIIE